MTWAGTEPIQAYAFTFISNGRIYRCITPRPCSNFFVEDIGPAPRAGLAIDCDVPEKVIAGRKARICLNVHNTGNIVAPRINVRLLVPPDTVVAGTTDGGVVTNDSVVWQLTNLPANTIKEICLDLKTGAPGTLAFSATASSPEVAPVQTACETAVVGIPAILLEKADDPDPVAIGTNTTYTVKVTNQGTAADANIHVIITVADELVPVSSSGGVITGQIVDFPLVPTLAPKAAVTLTVVAQGVKAGVAVTQFSLSSEMLAQPIHAGESTTVY